LKGLQPGDAILADITGADEYDLSATPLYDKTEEE